MQISDNVGIKENEPSFLYTSSMHGDELSGFVLSLRLIDYLLTNYGMNNRISNLINEIDIWINPLQILTVLIMGVIKMYSQQLGIMLTLLI